MQVLQGVLITFHEILHRPHLTGAPALAAGLNDPIGGAAAAAAGAVFDPLGRHFLFTAEGRFLKGQLQPGHDVFSPAGGILGAAPAAAASEKFTENITQVAEISEAAKAAAAVASGAGAEVGIHPGEAVLIVSGLFVRVGEHLVGLAHLFEFLFGGFISGIPVGVVFHGAFPVGFFDFLGAGVLFQT